MRILLPILLLMIRPALAQVQSETVFFLQPDGEHYLLERSIHSDSPTHRFHLDKQIRLDDIRHISPARFEWDDQSHPKLNSLSFDAGGFTLIYPGRFKDAELQRGADGELHYKSWNGRRDDQGRYGYWYSPGQFDQFTYTWIVPDNIELLRYRSNHQGQWTRRSNSVSFYAEKVNNLTFEMSYRVSDADAAPAVTTVAATEAGECPADTPLIAAVPAPGTAPAPSANAAGDTDRDAVKDSDDLCPGTPQGARVDRTGCPLDTDRDGVPDGVDQCIATPEETAVDGRGCGSSR